MTHDPINERTGLIPRQMREIDPDPLDWWEGPRGYEPHRLRKREAFSAWGALLLAVLLGLLLWAVAGLCVWGALQLFNFLRSLT